MPTGTEPLASESAEAGVYAKSSLERRLFRVLWKHTDLSTIDQHAQAAKECAKYLLRWESESEEEHEARVLPLLGIEKEKT